MARRSIHLYKAVQSWNWDAIDKFVKNGGDINASLVSKGPEAGYTALHFAAMKDDDHVLKLIENYRPDVNSVAANGAKPIHIAVLRKDLEVVDHLSSFGADVNAEFSKEVFKKHCRRGCWSNRFGGTMTPLAFAVISGNHELVGCLLWDGANVDVKDNHNKTLLMHALASDESRISFELSLYMGRKKPALLNARDNNGRHAAHYLLSNKGSGGFYQFLGRDMFDEAQTRFADDLIDAGANIHAMINGDPDTMLINFAAYKCYCEMLSRVLSFDVTLDVESKPLYYVMLPLDPEKYRRLFENFSDNQKEVIEANRQKCIELALKNLTLRRELELFVPDSEMKLLKKLYAEDDKAQQIIDDFCEDYIDNYLREEELSYGDKSITLFDLVGKVFNARRLKMLVKNDDFILAYKETHPYGVFKDQFKLLRTMHSKIHTAFQRDVLIQDIKNSLDLRKFIPLPYELMLIIFEYLNVRNLENFIRAFYKYEISFKYYLENIY